MSCTCELEPDYRTVAVHCDYCKAWDKAIRWKSNEPLREYVAANKTRASEQSGRGTQEQNQETESS